MPPLAELVSFPVWKDTRLGSGCSVRVQSVVCPEAHSLLLSSVLEQQDFMDPASRSPFSERMGSSFLGAGNLLAQTLFFSTGSQETPSSDLPSALGTFHMYRPVLTADITS